MWTFETGTLKKVFWWFPVRTNHTLSPKRLMHPFKVQLPAIDFPTVDGRNPAPPKKPRNDDSTVNTSKRYGFSWFQSGAGLRPSTVSKARPKQQGSLKAPHFATI